MTTAVLAAEGWKTNGEMIADVALLYELEGLVVDATYGDGGFWTVVRSAGLLAHDLDPIKGDGVDFRRLPEATGSVETLVLDPPYVTRGGRTTSTIPAMAAAYGMDAAARTPAEQWAVILAGVDEAARVLRSRPARRRRGDPRRGGMLWLKCQDYVSSGEQHWYTFEASVELARRGFRVIDRFVFVNGAGPQPRTNLDGTPRRQVHARNNVSMLLVAERRADVAALGRASLTAEHEVER